MSSQLELRGYRIGRKKIRYDMTEMIIDPIYLKMNLSKCPQRVTGVMYLLRTVVVERLQVWGGLSDRIAQYQGSQKGDNSIHPQIQF